MKLNETKVQDERPFEPETVAEVQAQETPRPQPPTPLSDRPLQTTPSPELEASPEGAIARPEEAGASSNKFHIDRNKLMLLGGGLAVTILFFTFSLILGHSPQRRQAPNAHSPQEAQKAGAKPTGSLIPAIDALRKPESTTNDGQLTPDDIKRMRPPDGSRNSPTTMRESAPSNPPKPTASLATVPSFADTQQRWEEPRPYRDEPETKPASTQQQPSVRESSLVFVKAQTQTSSTPEPSRALVDDEPLLEIKPGLRILAKLQAEISSADATPVVAEVEYTYAIGDEVVIPAGAQIYGHLQQADRSGYVSVKFEEIEFLDHRRERIDAVAKGLDMGPIKGKVTGKNTGKNLLVRSVSGIGSTMAMVFGNNTSSAFSEDDLIRERLAENAGTAGDSEIMNMALNSREVVSVPADTKIYVVFTKHEDSPSTLRKVN